MGTAWLENRPIPIGKCFCHAKIEIPAVDNGYGLAETMPMQNHLLVVVCLRGLPESNLGFISTENGKVVAGDTESCSVIVTHTPTAGSGSPIQCCSNQFTIDKPHNRLYICNVISSQRSNVHRALSLSQLYRCGPRPTHSKTIVSI